MKVLVFAPYAINTPHFETELEIIQTHLDSGDDVILLGCNANFLSCDVNLAHDIAVCLNCMGRRTEGIKLLSNPISVKPLYYLTEQNQQEIKQLKTIFPTLAELKSFKIENFDIGYAVLSSLISAIRDPEPDLVKYREILKRYLKSALAVYRSIQNYLSLYPIERVYVYNGRYAPMRAVLRACQSRSIECLVHEKASTIEKYSLCKNTTFHDIKYINNLIKEAWYANHEKIDKKQIASQFFIERYQGISRTWLSFTKNQTDNLLPDNWDENRINIVVFISSEDEFAAIGDAWKNPLYENQVDGLIKILNSIKNDNHIHLYIRVHPNLKNVKNKQSEQINSLKASNLTIIPPDSPISTYTLVQKASKVLTFGSTVGIEAVYWKIPSILVGQCFYRELGSTYNPKDHQELVEMLYAELPPKNKEGALMYGYYFNTYGIPFKYYQAKGILEGNFKGVAIKSDKNTLLLIRILRSRFTRQITCWLSKISILYNQL